MSRRPGKRERQVMLSCPGSLDKAVLVEEQQVDQDSRLSLDQRFSGGALHWPSRPRHQSLDRRFTRTATEDSQAASWSQGQRTTGTGDKHAAAARLVGMSMPVAVSVYCRSDESDKHSDNADESMEHWSLGQRTSGADYPQPVTTSTTVGTIDDSQLSLMGRSTTVRTTAGSQAVQRSPGQRTVGADEQRPTTAAAVCLSDAITEYVHCMSDESSRHSDKTGKFSGQLSLGQRTTNADCQLPMTSLHCQWKQAGRLGQGTLDHWLGSDDRGLLTTGLHHRTTAVEQQDNLVGSQRPMTASQSHEHRTRQVLVMGRLVIYK